MIKYFGYFVINNYSLDVASNKIRDKKSYLRDKTNNNNIKSLRNNKNNSITKSHISFNNNKNKNKKTCSNLRNSLINKNSNKILNLK